jgi:hypothetical protein
LCLDCGAWRQLLMYVILLSSYYQAAREDRYRPD